jgi:hypothetical protein
MSSKFASPFMQKSPVEEKNKLEKLRKEVEMARRAAFIRSKSDSEDYEESPEENKAKRIYKRLRKKLDRKENKEQK